MPAIVVSDTGNEEEEILGNSNLGYSGLDSIKIPSSRFEINQSSEIYAGDSDFAMAGGATGLPSRKYYNVKEDKDFAVKSAPTRTASPDAANISNESKSSVVVSTDFSPLYSSELGAIDEGESSVLEGVSSVFEEQ